MASAMRKMAVYLGLVEDDHRYQDKYDTYGEYEDYDDQADRAEPADEPDPRGVRRDGEAGGEYVGYQAPDWRTEHVFTATFETMLTQPLVIHFYDEVFQGEGIALRNR